MACPTGDIAAAGGGAGSQYIYSSAPATNATAGATGASGGNAIPTGFTFAASGATAANAWVIAYSTKTTGWTMYVICEP
jgi:hypothetical protein